MGRLTFEHRWPNFAIINTLTFLPSKATVYCSIYDRNYRYACDLDGVGVLTTRRLSLRRESRSLNVEEGRLGHDEY